MSMSPWRLVLTWTAQSNANGKKRMTTITIPDEIAQWAGAEASRSGQSVEELLQRCLVAGVVQEAVDLQLEEQTKKKSVTPPVDEQVAALATLSVPATDKLGDEEQLAHDELLRDYRQRLVQRAQRITDWLGRGVGEAPTQVTHLLTVKSGMLYAVGYSVQTQMLEVVFNSGGIYRYFHVPPHIYEGLIAAESKGQYMWTHLFHLYPYARIRRG